MNFTGEFSELLIRAPLITILSLGSYVIFFPGLFRFSAMFFLSAMIQRAQMSDISGDA